MESRLLRVDLTTGEMTSEVIPHALFQRWIGGSGINNWIMWEHFLTHDINCDPRGPDNIFVFGVGLREEASKLLLFVPLLPLLRRWGDRLDVLATLIDAYEARHHAMDPPDPVQAIKFRMEKKGMTRKDLEDIIGSRTRIAEA